MKTKIIGLAIISFFLNLVWENAQAPFFYNGYISFAQHFPMCLLATFGDMLITVLIFYFIALIKKDQRWMLKQGVGEYAALAFVGLLIAIGIEQNALLLGKWSYGEAMPLLPYLRVGLLPVLQMFILTPLSFYLTGRLKQI